VEGKFQKIAFTETPLSMPQVWVAGLDRETFLGEANVTIQSKKILSGLCGVKLL